MIPANSLALITTVCSMISLIGGFVCVGFYVKKKFSGDRAQAIYWELLLWMALSDIGAAAADILMWGTDEAPHCLSQALLISFFDWASVAWVVCVACACAQSLNSWTTAAREESASANHVRAHPCVLRSGSSRHCLWQYIMIAGKRGETDNFRLLIAYHSFCWGSSVLFTLLPLVDGFNEDGACVSCSEGTFCTIYGLANATPCIGLIPTAEPPMTCEACIGRPATYGYDGDWCWLVAGADKHWVYTIFYAPLWVNGPSHLPPPISHLPPPKVSHLLRLPSALHICPSPHLPNPPPSPA